MSEEVQTCLWGVSRPPPPPGELRLWSGPVVHTAPPRPGQALCVCVPASDVAASTLPETFTEGTARVTWPMLRVVP